MSKDYMLKLSDSLASVQEKLEKSLRSSELRRFFVS